MSYKGKAKEVLRRAFSHALKPVYQSSKRPGHDYARFGRLGIHTVSDPDLMKTVLMAPDRFVGPPFVNKTMAKVIGDAMINAEGEAWTQLHDILKVGFSSKSVKERIIPIILEESDALVKDWQRRSGTVLDIEHEMLASTGRVISRVVFGDGMAKQDAEAVITLISDTVREFEGQSGVVSKALKIMNTPYSHSAFIPSMLLRASGIRDDYPAAIPEKIMQTRKKLDEMVLPHIKARRKLAKQPNDILGTLIDGRKQPGNIALNDREILDQLLMVIVTGYETTATALTFTIDEVLKEPPIQKKLAAEFNQVAGKKPLTVENRNQLSYAQDVFQEGIRLHPSVRMITRESTGSFDYGDVKINDKDLILIDLVALHRREDLFPNAKSFMPERYSDPDFQKTSYRPFGMGPRMCTGTPMARPEGQIYLSKIFGRFNFEVVQPLEGETHFFTMRPKGRLLVKATPR